MKKGCYAVLDNYAAHKHPKARSHRRSLAETAMCRYKTLIGQGLRSRSFDRQKTEAAVAVHCLNRFTALGMPKSVRIA